ncbi:MAG: S24 family peptidase [Clostridia bacterium]
MDSYQKEVYKQTIKDAIGKEPLTHFAQRAGLSAGNLSRIKNNGQKASVETLQKIAEASETVSFEELMRAAGLPLELKDGKAAGTASAKGMLSIPIVRELRYPKEQLKEDPDLEWEDFYRGALGDGDYIVFVADDNALSSQLHAGDRVFVDLAKKPEDGNAVLFRLNSGETMLRRLRKSGRKYIYYGDDRYLYPEISVKKTDVEIYGVAVGAVVQL